ncbi:hypothetical protein CPB86DRAFT_776868 [Serendipita vermifera]|nr:hypothetical protein CPB86DRAFT_776868 [Serendipita vermifera]
MPSWDPVILLSQIVAMQALHYLTLAILIPPALAIFGSRQSLSFFGGPANVNFIMSWKELAGRATVPPDVSIDGIYSSGLRIATSTELQSLNLHDSGRRWVIAATWLLTSLADVYYIFSFIRKPRLVLDFTLTIFFNHIILTTYYSAAFPTSVFFWFIMGLCATITILLAEQLCVRRELSQDFKPVTSTDDPDDQVSEHSDGRQSMELRTFAG